MLGVAIPVFHPVSVQQILDYGVHADTLTCILGIFTSMKFVGEIVVTSSTGLPQFVQDGFGMQLQC